MKTAPERTALDTSIRNPSMEVGTSSLNDYTLCILRRRLRMSSQHPLENIINDPNKGMRIRSSLKNLCAFSACVSLIEPKNVKEVLQEPEWIIAMQNELNEFERNKVSDLVE